MYVLGIETSCDETSCAIVKGRKVLSNVTVSSLKYHKKYGGIIPEIATRNHLKFIEKVFKIALSKAKVNIKDIEVIGVTYRPGLLGALVVGLNFAKAVSSALAKPFLGINHLHAHLFSPFLDNNSPILFPFIGLLASGGHTDIFLVEDYDKIKTVGTTRDDACGEAFDKVAKLLGLGYPGGKHHGEILSRQPGHVGDRIKQLHVDGKVEVVVGELHEFDYGRIPILCFNPGGGMVQPADAPEVVSLRLLYFPLQGLVPILGVITPPVLPLDESDGVTGET